VATRKPASGAEQPAAAKGSTVADLEAMARPVALRDAPAVGGAGAIEQAGFYKAWHRRVEAEAPDRPGEARAAALAAANSERVWQLLRAMPLGLVFYDEQFRIVYQNLASEVMTGYATAEFVGRSPIGLWMPEEDRVNSEEDLRRMREERVALFGRNVHVRRDARQAWVHWYTTPLFDGERFVGYLGTHTDLSEEARAAKQQAELLIDAAVDISIVQISFRGRIQTWNRNAAVLFGCPAEQALGSPLDSLFRAGEVDRELPSSLLAKARAGTRAEYEGWLRRGPEGEFWGNVLLYPQFDDDGSAIAFVMVARDLSDRRLAELQLRDSEALLAAIVSATSDAILGINAEGRVVLSNPAAERIFGRSAAALKDGPLPEILPRDDLQSLIGAGLTLTGRRDDGRTLHLEVSATQTSAGGRSLLTLTARDVTERVESETALRQYREQLSALARDLMEAEQKTNRRLAQLLHDQLGQTLTSLRIFVDALRARLPASRDSVVQKGWSQISSLIDLGMSKVREVLVELRPVLLQAQGLAVALDNEVQAQAAAHPEVQIELRTADRLAARRWEADVEYAAFMVAREAIGNALVHSRCHHVTVRLEELNTLGLRLAIEDDGKGMVAPEHCLKPGHLGLVGMRERALGIGAQLQIDAASDGCWTTIELRYRP
jgi:PAS domain S-box-containing protein